MSSAWPACVLLTVVAVLGASAACSDEDEQAPPTTLIGPSRPPAPTPVAGPPSQLPAPNPPPAPNLTFGPVADPFGSCPSIQFIVRGIVVVTDRSTKFDRIACVDLVTGRIVNVRGRTRFDGKMHASRVEPR
ncbi:MAG TPA: DUF5666 domain-containing protein [Vicinamibacterales bacterium]|nr:DUF5666 domain-containing protein [Vicinamibacterales bacterium]